MTVNADLLKSAAEEQQAAPDEAGLESVATLVAQQLDYEDLVSELELTLKSAKEALRRISQEDLPAAMAEHHMTGWTTTDGAEVKVKPLIYAAIPKANREPAFAWLERRGYGDLIKHTIKATFGKGEEVEAAKALKALKAEGFEPEDARSVNYQTISAQVREWIKEGTAFPAELLGVFQGQETKITRKKES